MILEVQSYPVGFALVKLLFQKQERIGLSKGHAIHSILLLSRPDLEAGIENTWDLERSLTALLRPLGFGKGLGKLAEARLKGFDRHFTVLPVHVAQVPGDDGAQKQKGSASHHGHKRTGGHEQQS